MNTFVWTGYVAGERKEGVLQAPTLENAISMLRSQSVIVTKMTLQSPVNVPKNAAIESLDLSKISRTRIAAKEKLIILKKLHTMLAAGLPIVECLEMMINQSSKRAQPVLSYIYREILEGVQLSDSLKNFPKLFDTVVVNLISAGEMSGQLDVFLAKAVAYTERQANIKKAIKSAVTYPTVLLTVAVTVVAVMMVKVVPAFQNLFSGGGKALPAPTQIVVDISEFMRSPEKILPVLTVLLILFSSHVIASKKSLGYRRKFHNLMLRLPVIRGLLINSNLAKISMITGNLYEAGVSLVDTLDVTNKSVTVLPINESLNDVGHAVMEGKPLSTAFAKYPTLYPPTFTALIQVGESSGQLSQMLGSVNDYYGAEFDESVKQFTALLEPIMIVFMGVVIGGILVAMYMPMFTMGDAF